MLVCVSGLVVSDEKVWCILVLACGAPVAAVLLQDLAGLPDVRRLLEVVVHQISGPLHNLLLPLPPPEALEVSGSDRSCPRDGLPVFWHYSRDSAQAVGILLVTGNNWS